MLVKVGKTNLEVGKVADTVEGIFKKEFPPMLLSWKVPRKSDLPSETSCARIR